MIFICLGALAINSLPITQFPDIVPPSVTVTARYTGASADVMSKTVATPLERAINGVPGMTYMTTVCTNDGMSLTTIYFKVGTDPDVAAVNVQNRVTTVLDERRGGGERTEPCDDGPRRVARGGDPGRCGYGKGG